MDLQRQSVDGLGAAAEPGRDAPWLELADAWRERRYAHNLTVMATAVFDAVRNGRFRQVKFLLDNGVSIRTKNQDGQNLLIYTLHLDNALRRSKMFKFLIKRGVDCCEVDPQTGRDVLSWACALGRDQEADAVLRAAAGDIDLHRFDNEGLTCLHHATKSGNIDLVQTLLEVFRKYRLSVDINDKEGLSPYLHAKRLGFHDIANMILQIGNASPQQYDGNFRHSAEGWAFTGMLERQRAAKTDFIKLLASYKMRGRIPPVKRMEDWSKLPSLVLTTTDNQTHTLDSCGNSIVPESEPAGGDRAGTDRTDGPRASSMHAASSLQRPARMARSLDTAFTLLSKIDAEKSSHVTEFVASEFDTSKAEEFGGRFMQLNHLMTSLAEQQSSAFRQPAKPPTPPPTPKPEPKKKKGSTLAIIFGRDKKHSRKYNRGKQNDRSNINSRKRGRHVAAASHASTGNAGSSTPRASKRKYDRLPPLH